jgi:hypothetical protein
VLAWLEGSVWNLLGKLSPEPPGGYPSARIPPL